MKKNYSKLFENSSDVGNNMGRLFLKTAGRSWDSKLTGYAKNLGFSRVYILLLTYDKT